METLLAYLRLTVTHWDWSQLQCGAVGESCFKSEMSMVLTAQLLPCGRPAVHGDRDGPGRVVMRVSIRSAFPHVIAAVQADVHTFVQELFDGAPREF